MTTNSFDVFIINKIDCFIMNRFKKKDIWNRFKKNKFIFRIDLKRIYLNE